MNGTEKKKKTLLEATKDLIKDKKKSNDFNLNQSRLKKNKTSYGERKACVCVSILVNE